MCSLWDCSRNNVLFFSENMAYSALLLSVPSHLSFIQLLVFPSLSWSFYAVCIWKFSLVEVWETARHRLQDFSDLAALVCTRVSTRELWSGLYIMIPALERSAWVPARWFEWHWEWKWMYNWKWPRHGMCWGRVTKPRRLPIAGFQSNKHFDFFFMCHTRT
jgi:hypothetical protein